MNTNEKQLTIPSGEPSLEEQLEAENVRSTELNVLIEALEMISPESLGLRDEGFRLYKQLMTELSYQEFVYLPTKKGIAPLTVLGKIIQSNTIYIKTLNIFFIYFLGIDNNPPNESFTYTEKKSIQQACLVTATSRILQPAINFIKDKHKQPQFNVFELAQLKQEFITTSQRHQHLQRDLLMASFERLNLLKQAAEIKAGPQLANELDETRLRLELFSEKSR